MFSALILEVGGQSPIPSSELEVQQAPSALGLGEEGKPATVDWGPGAMGKEVLPAEAPYMVKAAATAAAALWCRLLRLTPGALFALFSPQICHGVQGCACCGSFPPLLPPPHSQMHC